MSVQICPDRDRECGQFERNWCSTCPNRKPTDTERLDFMQAHPERRLDYRKRRWSFNGFTNYEYEVYPTLREAVDAAIKETK